MDTAAILTFIANVLVALGAVIFGTAAIGLYKFRDVYTRISAVGTSAGLGISLVVIGVFCLLPSWPNFIKLLLILFLQLATSSIGTMAIARAAYLTGSPMRPGFFDQLAEDHQDPTEHVTPDQDVSQNTDDDTDPDADTAVLGTS